MPGKPIRSALYMPANNGRALEKARTLPVDAVIFDLEDSVSPDSKSAARTQASQAVRRGGYGGRAIVVRTNAMDTDWGQDDLQSGLDAAPDAILVPKVSTVEDIDALNRIFRDCGTSCALWIMIETPLAIMNIAAIAARSSEANCRLTCFVLGTNDLARETGARLTPDRVSFVTWISQTICAARAYRLSVLDGVFNNYSDAEGLERECRQGRDLGFDGKTLIHPSQIDICNDVFSPSEDEIAWARRIVDAFDLPENQGKNVLSIDGQMVEHLHAEMARKTIAIAEKIEADSRRR